MPPPPLPLSSASTPLSCSPAPLPRLLSPCLRLSLQDNLKSITSKLEDSERLRRGSINAEQKCRHALAVARDEKRAADAKLAVTEEELSTLKSAHRDVNFRARLDWATRRLASPQSSVAQEEPSAALLTWTESTRLHYAVAAGFQRSHLLQGGAGDDPDATMTFLKSLNAREAVQEVICSPVVLDEMVSMFWDRVQGLH